MNNRIIPHPGRLAAQLYTIRQFTRTAADFSASMKKIRQMGYTAVQISAIGPIPDPEVKAILDEEGLEVCITHIGFDRLQNEIEAVIQQHRLWNCQNVAVGSMPVEYRADEASFRRFAQEAQAVGKKLYEAGLTFSYHNHSFEFTRFGKRTGLQLLFEETDARYLQAELDTYWIQHGGGDPAAWILQMKDRMPVVHLKDMVIQDGNPVMAEIGNGNLNWAAILEACREAGVKWYAVEQDVCQRDPFESLKISYENLSSMGLS